MILAILILSGGLNRVRAQECWGNYRGNAALTGVAEAELPDDPSLVWTFKTNDAIKAPPVVCQGIIVVGSVDGNVYGITMDGKLKWKVNTGNGIESPALIAKGRVYIGNLDGKVFALELNTGRLLWTYETEGQIMGAPNYMDTGSREILIVGSYDYYLHGIDAETGKGLWKYETDNFINGTPAVYRGYAIFGGCDGLLHQVDISNGTLKKKTEVATYVAGSVAVENWITYVGDYDGKFSCLDIRKGEVLWSFENKNAQLPFIASPSLDREDVIIGNRDKYVYCFHKKDGKLKWKVNSRGRVDASPVVAGNRIVVVTMRGDIMYLDRNNGNIDWTYELGSPISGNPAVVNDFMFVGADDGRVYCFGNK